MYGMHPPQTSNPQGGAGLPIMGTTTADTVDGCSGSNINAGLPSSSQSDINEAYKRLGLQLSRTACGDDQPPRNRQSSKHEWVPQPSERSAFGPFDRRRRRKENEDNNNLDCVVAVENTSSFDSSSIGEKKKKGTSITSLATTTAASSPSSSQSSLNDSSATDPNSTTYGVTSERQDKNTTTTTITTTEPTTSLTADGEVILYDRTHKVAKKNLKDHGSHQQVSPPVSGSVLKKLTFHAKHTFRQISIDQENSILANNQDRSIKCGKKRVSPNNSFDGSLQHQHLSDEHHQQPPPHTLGSLGGALNAYNTNTNGGHNGDISNTLRLPGSCINKAAHGTAGQSKGLLNSVLEGSSIDSTSDHPMSVDQQSVSRKEETSVVSSAPSLGQAASVNRYPRGKCLTTPSQPFAKDARDNVEGNLIVYENDLIRLPRRDVKEPPNTSSKHRSSTSARTEILEFRVVSLLGQGTFAQVFKCQNLDTGDLVAVKIVKNKDAYTRQAAVEIEIFSELSKLSKTHAASSGNDSMVKLLNYFVYENHLCLSFELLGLNLYEILKRRQFRGLPLSTVKTLLRQAVTSVKELSSTKLIKPIVHCDLKPENILVVNQHYDATVEDRPHSNSSHPASLQDEKNEKIKNDWKIKLIDFGSACFEGATTHTYIQSRFYRSPEVLIGLPYDSAIDMWSLGCVAAELFLGLPILPGVHEHDQLLRIIEMIGPIPDKRLEEGSKTTKFFCKYLVKQSNGSSIAAVTPSPELNNESSSSPPPPIRTSWRIKTQQEFIASLSPEELQKRGGRAKLGKQPANKYFSRTKLVDIVRTHGERHSMDMESVTLFVHFLQGILHPDPWERWTAYQASTHPFITGSKLHTHTQQRGEGIGRSELRIHWKPPYDTQNCTRKIKYMDALRKRQSRQQEVLRTSPRSSRSIAPPGVEPESAEINGTTRVTAMTDAMSLSQHRKPQSGPGEISSAATGGISHSPPAEIGINSITGRQQRNVVSHRNPGMLPPPAFVGSLGTAAGAMQASPYLGASSLTDVHPGVHSAMLMSPSVHGIPAGTMIGEFSLGQQMPISSGPQSFSGLSTGYDGVHVPLEADLGYALQRPGVLPVGGVPGLHPQQPQQLAMTSSYASPHHQYAASRSMSFGGHPNRPGSFTNSNVSASTRRRSLTKSFATQLSAPLSPYMSNSIMASTASIKEDDPDAEKTPTSSGTMSLLAQQLAEHSDSNQPSSQDQINTSASNVREQQQQLPATASSVPQHYFNPSMAYSTGGVPPGQIAAAPAGFYYIAADGTRVMAPAPPQAMPICNGSSFPDQMQMSAAAAYGGTPMQLSQSSGVVAPPPPIPYQPSVEEIEHYQQQMAPYMVPPPQKPPPQYHGMSM